MVKAGVGKPTGIRGEAPCRSMFSDRVERTGHADAWDERDAFGSKIRA